ncbi:MAG: L-threonylcarbamoyladenylate synthase [Deltaproteobacteria bacterium]|nr:L-threonylcarbamoyladenylate synthase [Deltaproteobacteria bacterium]
MTPEDPRRGCPDWLERAATVVREGAVVALPFERLFGLAANALDACAVARVAAIKGPQRAVAGGRPLAVIVPDRDAIASVALDFPPLAQELAASFWPGPLTLLLRARPGLPRELVGPGGLVGVRVPGPCPAALLAKACGCALTATSANPTGGADALTHEDLATLGGIDLIVSGRVPGPPGSTVVDVSGDRAVVLRSGIVDIGERGFR